VEPCDNELAFQSEALLAATFACRASDGEAGSLVGVLDVSLELSAPILELLASKLEYNLGASLRGQYKCFNISGCLVAGPAYRPNWLAAIISGYDA